MKYQVLYATLASALTISCGIARADIDPNSGIDFVRIGAVGNAPWMGGPIGYFDTPNFSTWTSS